MADHSGIDITCAGQEYRIHWWPGAFVGNKHGYYYLNRYDAQANVHYPIARFTDEGEARRFMEFLQRVIPSGREV